MPLWALVLMAEVALAVALTLTPHLAAGHALIIPVPPRWDLPARMLVANRARTNLDWRCSAAGRAARRDACDVPDFCHSADGVCASGRGRNAAQRVLRGLLLGLFAYSGFFLVIALAIERIGIAASFAIAGIVAGVIQFLTLRIIRGSPASGRRQIGFD